MRVRRLVAIFSLFAVLFAFVPNVGRSAAQNTFTFGAEVRLCDYTQDPATLDPSIEEFGPSAYCQIPVDGAEILVAIDGGADLGTCVTEAHPGPQGGFVNSCSLEGFERDTDYQFELDLTTVPSGYDFAESVIDLSIGDEIPGGGETFAVSFRGTKGTPPDNTNSGEAFQLSAEVRLCDYDQPEEDLSISADSEFFGPWVYCQLPVEGASITVATEGGEVLGTCETATHDAPQDAIVNSCSIPGFTYNTNYVATLDESTIPAGFTIVSNPVTLEIGDEIPGGGETFPISFHGDKGDIPADVSVEPGSTVAPGSSDFEAVILNGTCENALTTAETLNPPVLEQGPAVGQSGVVAPYVSFDTVATPLDTLIDEPHSVAVFQNDDMILCGEIGGVDNDDGVLRLVLQSVDGNSSFVGLAALSYGDDSANSTDVVIYVIPI